MQRAEVQQYSGRSVSRFHWCALCIPVIFVLLQVSFIQINHTIKFHGIQGRETEDEGKTAFLSQNVLGIPVFANNFMESKVRLNTLLEMHRCMEDCFCLDKQKGARAALCLMCLLASPSTFNSSQKVLSYGYSAIEGFLQRLYPNYRVVTRHTHTNTPDKLTTRLSAVV